MTTASGLHGQIHQGRLRASRLSKKSKKGMATPKYEIDLVRTRLRTAEKHYKLSYEQVTQKDKAHDRA
jgi:hypothetical protein